MYTYIYICNYIYGVYVYTDMSLLTSMRSSLEDNTLDNNCKSISLSCKNTTQTE